MRMVVVLPEPLGPRKPHTSPAGTAISTLLTASLLAEALGQAVHVDGVLVHVAERGERGVHGSGVTSTGWPGLSLQAARGTRLELEDELLAIGDGEDHRRREFLLLRDEGDGGRQVLGAAVAADAHASDPSSHAENSFSGTKKRTNTFSRRQQRDHRRRGRNVFAAGGNRCPRCARPTRAVIGVARAGIRRCPASRCAWRACALICSMRACASS